MRIIWTNAIVNENKTEEDKHRYVVHRLHLRPQKSNAPLMTQMRLRVAACRRTVATVTKQATGRYLSFCSHFPRRGVLVLIQLS